MLVDVLHPDSPWLNMEVNGQQDIQDSRPSLHQTDVRSKLIRLRNFSKNES